MLDRLQSYIPTALLFGLIFYFSFPADDRPARISADPRPQRDAEAETAELDRSCTVSSTTLKCAHAFCATRAFPPIFWKNGPVTC